MGKRADTIVLDGSLDVIATADKQIACSAEPTTYTEANSTYALADAAMAGGDFTKAAGDVSGRKVTMAAKSGALIDVSGSATHIALVRTSDSKLLLVTTCTTQALTANGSNTVNFPSWKAEARAPS